MRKRSAFAILLLALMSGGSRVRTNGIDTRLLAQPAVSATHVAFLHAGDLWSARLDGSDVRRLMTSEGPVSNPAFSPDGQTLAFSANYNGNTDVFVVPLEGGPLTRLTWHPSPNLVQGFTPAARRGARLLCRPGGWVVENEGVPPDIDVEQTPAEVTTGTMGSSSKLSPSHSTS